MTRKSFFILNLLINCAFFNSFANNLAISINGPACTVAGGSNGVSYTVSGATQLTDNLKWVVTGGIIVATKSSSLSGTIAAIGTQVRIIWTPGAISTSITVTDNAASTANLNVTAIVISNIITSASSASVRGSSVTLQGGGPSILSCQPLYSYWWEVSDSSSGPFIAINGAAGQNLQIDSTKKKGFFRRAIAANGDVFYSNVIFINVSQTTTIGLNNPPLKAKISEPDLMGPMEYLAVSGNMLLTFCKSEIALIDKRKNRSTLSQDIQDLLTDIL